MQGRADDTQVHWTSLRRAWREGWTAPRIVVAGLISGFIAGKLEPSKGRAVASQATRWVQMFSAVSGMFTAMQAQAASDEAERAGDHAARAADNAEAVANEESVVPTAPLAPSRPQHRTRRPTTSASGHRARPKRPLKFPSAEVDSGRKACAPLTRPRRIMPARSRPSAMSPPFPLDPVPAAPAPLDPESPPNPTPRCHPRRARVHADLPR